MATPPSGIPSGFGSALGGFLTNPLLEQIFVWQVLQQITSTVLGPEMAGLQQEIYSKNSSLQLSIADAVEAVIKSHYTEKQGEDEAALSGVKAERFRTLIANAGDPPGLDFLTEAYRRGFIPWDDGDPNGTSATQGIRESRLKNKWIKHVREMEWHLAPVGSIIEGWLRAQIPEAQALALLAKNGVDEPTARLMYNSAGRPPGPMELIELYRRGVIPEAGEGGATLSLRQGYLETDLKNKWYAKWLELARYVPPPRTVTALLRQGTITDAEALALFKDAGLDQHLAAAYVANAHHHATAATRELAKADILALYTEKYFPEAEALKHLEDLGYPAPVAAFELAIADFRAEKALITSAVNRVRNAYIARKLEKAEVIRALDALAMKPAQRDQLITIWEMERAENVATLTAAEIVHAAKLGIATEDYATAWLQAHGFSAHDAWLRLGLGLGGTPTAPEPPLDPLPA